MMKNTGRLALNYVILLLLKSLQQRSRSNFAKVYMYLGLQVYITDLANVAVWWLRDREKGNTLVLASQLVCRMNSRITIWTQGRFICTTHHWRKLALTRITLYPHLCYISPLGFRSFTFSVPSSPQHRPPRGQQNTPPKPTRKHTTVSKTKPKQNKTKPKKKF
jgi:hypothetical protein